MTTDREYGFRAAELRSAPGMTSREESKLANITPDPDASHRFDQSGSGTMVTALVASVFG
jgi:hypothetical protein